MIKKTIISISLIATASMASMNNNHEMKQETIMWKMHKQEMKMKRKMHRQEMKMKRKMHRQEMKMKRKMHRQEIRKEIKNYKQEIKELKPLINKSHSNYNRNTHGVITERTLAKWIDNWSKNKPKDIEGKLIILQAGPTLYSENGKGYIKPKEEEGVYVYDIGLNGACDTSFKRFDGVSEIQAAIINTDMMNFQLNALHIDPTKDMIVLVTTASSNDAMKGLTRVWMTFKYYSVDMKHISFLNGSASYDFGPKTKFHKYLGSRTSGWPEFGNFDIRTLGPSGINLFATTEDMMEAASEKLNLHFITDGRGTAAYQGEKSVKASDKNCGEDGNSQCYTAFKGHIKTAADMPYTDFYDTNAKEDINEDGVIDSKDASYKFKSYKQLKKYFRKNGYRKGQIIDAYCRTGRKANLALMTASEVLGYPAKLYDGSWIQWGQLANTKDKNGTEILPKDNKWRTDVPKYSEVIKYEDFINIQPIVHVDYNEPTTINAGSEVRIDPNGTTTSLQVDEDRNDLSSL